MRQIGPLSLLTAALLLVSCHTLGAPRGVAMLLALLTGAFAWLAHRGHARAGGTGTGSGTDAGVDTTAAATMAADTAAVDTTHGTGTTADPSDDGLTVGPCLSEEGPPPAGSSSSSGGVGNSDDEGGTLGPCLSKEPDLGPCLCSCELDEGGTHWAPALLLPVVARRRRRESLEHLAAQGRLPPDVVQRLRARLGASEPDHREPPA